MDAADIIQVIERGAQEYFNGLLQEVRTNLGTTYYRRLSTEGLTRRMTVVYKGLENWLVGRNEAAVQTAGQDLGKLRFNEGTPLGQVVLSLVLEEKYLRRYIADQGVSLGDEWSKVISEYFQKLIYNTAQGFEACLAKSNRLSERAVPVPHSSPAEAQPQQPSELEISRAGQIGEVSG